MGKRKKNNGKELIAVFQLSTGYKVPIEAEEVLEQGVDHLANALIGEIAMPALKEGGGAKRVGGALEKEIAECVGKLTAMEKEALLRGLIWQLTLSKWSEL